MCDRNHTKGYQIPDEDVIKMVKILAPLADPKHAQNSKDSPLNLAAKFGSTEILKILLQYFDANVHHLGGFLPIDKAMFHQRIEAIKILAPFTKELRVHEFFVKYGCAKEVEVLESLIEERKANGLMENPNKKARLTI